MPPQLTDCTGSWRGTVTHCTNAADSSVVQEHKVEADFMSHPEQSSDGGGVAAAGVLQGVVNAQANRPGSEEGLKCAQADADIFDALFCKWGRDEETNMQ
ncbi:hypothetical protein OEZ86_000700 [Tetradesmus obliquus]|nr:hypothetical protein OEZ86_000700 [Tetradesmus obliquus]